MTSAAPGSVSTLEEIEVQLSGLREKLDDLVGERNAAEETLVRATISDAPEAERKKWRSSVGILSERIRECDSAITFLETNRAIQMERARVALIAECKSSVEKSHAAYKSAVRRMLSALQSIVTEFSPVYETYSESISAVHEAQSQYCDAAKDDRVFMREAQRDLPPVDFDDQQLGASLLKLGEQIARFAPREPVVEENYRGGYFSPEERSSLNRPVRLLGASAEAVANGPDSSIPPDRPEPQWLPKLGEPETVATATQQ